MFGPSSHLQFRQPTVTLIIVFQVLGEDLFYIGECAHDDGSQVFGADQYYNIDICAKTIHCLYLAGGEVLKI